MQIQRFPSNFPVEFPSITTTACCIPGETHSHGKMLIKRSASGPCTVHKKRTMITVPKPDTYSMRLKEKNTRENVEISRFYCKTSLAYHVLHAMSLLAYARLLNRKEKGTSRNEGLAITQFVRFCIFSRKRCHRIRTQGTHRRRWHNQSGCEIHMP